MHKTGCTFKDAQIFVLQNNMHTCNCKHKLHKSTFHEENKKNVHLLEYANFCALNPLLRHNDSDNHAIIYQDQYFPFAAIDIQYS